ncbi:MAG: HD domain-containing protein [Candidatus Spechtbacteria bacterium SB0662_bin_43]|uniref:HD domain-containing protein n=1 Tax=Candidatus Spechtbacteria bacterium SB0662_bin_43 TaxID=2604897 RepID=A0A845DJH9_9BACT|nr:HD domain-containing protein [Candidatus Spechtbacteria bacterium SB0662_bin_43]
MNNHNGIPVFVKNTVERLMSSGFESYIVGGSVRDIVMGIEPKDWDVATSAKPHQIQAVFPNSFYENEFGTVGVKIDSESGDTAHIIEVTSFRTEEKYSDNRHPDNVVFTDSLEKDLARRDFTMNAIAMRLDGSFVDPFDGVRDIRSQTIRAVGDPNARFSEDALRILRAVRFIASLDFTIEHTTQQAIRSNASLLRKIAYERIGAEISRLFEGQYSHKGIEAMRILSLLDIILPEVAKGIGVSQNKHHIYDVYEHNLFSLKWADENNYPFAVKVAALLHDVAKPQTKKGDGTNATFHGHDIMSAKVAYAICERFRWSRKECEHIALLVRHHMFYYDIDEVTEKSVRRLVSKVGKEKMDDLVKLRICDRMGSGVPKPEPYRLRHFQFMVEKVQKDPITVGMLDVNGNDIMKTLSLSPSPRIGYLLAALFEEVLDNPQHNTKEHLLQRAQELNKLSDDALIALYTHSKEKEHDTNEQESRKIKKKYFVE